MASSLLVVLTVVLVITGCAPPPAAPVSAPGPAALRTAIDANRQLVLAIGRGPETLGSLPLRQISGPANPFTAVRVFNAGLAINDEREVPRPYLAEALPALNTDTWRVFPDGRMETTYRLKPNLTWHDGAPLTADDFAFAYRVYASPELGRAASPPIAQIEEVRAPDARTVVVAWRQPFADADDLQATGLPPLPRHLLEVPFQRRDADAFVAHPFWTTEYVGLGPYRLTGWELGTSMEGEAFAGHALGRPKIARVRLIFMTDPNAALANLLAGNAHLAVDNALQTQQAVVLDREWGDRGTGVVLRSPNAVRGAHFQLRPEFANPRIMLDVRARRAIAHAIDRQSLADTVTEGKGTTADTYVVPNAEFYAEAARVITTFPYDLRRTEQLLGEVGYTKGADGFYAHPADGKLNLEVAVTDANPTEATIMVDQLRRAGVDSTLRVIPRAQTSEPMIFSNYTGILNGQFTGAFAPPLTRFRASELQRPENRFLGANFPGYNSPEFERLVAAYEASLDRAERNRLAVQMLKLTSEDVPAFPLLYFIALTVHTSDLRGPLIAVSTAAAPWNIHEWEWIR